MGIPAEQIDRLRAAFEAIQMNKTSLQAGDIVMINPVTDGAFRVPSQEKPGIIGEFLTRPITPQIQMEYGDLELGSPHGAMTFDCIIHILTDEEDCLPFLFDSRRLIKIES